MVIDDVALHRAAIETASAVIARVADADLTRATPRSRLVRLTQIRHAVASMMRRCAPPWSIPPNAS